MLFLEQFRRRDIQRLGQALDHIDRRIPDAALDAADVRAIQPGHFGELLLRPAFVFANAPDVYAKWILKSHGRMVIRTMAGRLQTMRHICGRMAHGPACRATRMPLKQ